MCTMTLNNQLNGIELYFEVKPESNIITALKRTGWRWHRLKKCWYNRQNVDTLKQAKTLSNDTQNIITETAKTKQAKTQLSLWDRLQFKEGITDTSKFQYKFVGSNYSGLSVKETASIIRKNLKTIFPEVKFSVTSDYNKIDITIKSSPYNNKHLEYSPEIEPCKYREYEEKHNKELHGIKSYCRKLIDSYNYDDSDTMTDYFYTHFYDNISIDYNYIQTEQTEDIKNDITDFRNKLIEAEKAEEQRKEIEYQEYLKQCESDKQQAEQRLIQDEINRKVVESNVTYTDLTAEQYMLINCKFAKLNKNNTLEEYTEEVNKGEYYNQDIKITREVHFQTVEALNLFNNMLLYDFDFISGTGGSYTDDNRFTDMMDYNRMSKEERETVKWNLYGIAVYYNNQLQYVIDAQGHSYARYVGLTDEATKETITEQQPLTEEQQTNKNIAESIEDYSTIIIADNNLADTWKESEEYRTALKETLQMYNIKLTKEIIQQINILELKQYLYDLLTCIDSVQEQFAKAGFKDGDKITIIKVNDFGMVSNSKVTYNSYVNTKYAQYNDAVKITFTPIHKRKLYYTHLCNGDDFIIADGWRDIPESILFDITESNGMICKASKYGSCDRQQLIDIKNYLTNNSVNILVDRINK